MIFVKKLKGSGLMAKPKSFLANILIERAKRSHNCQHNSNHRICAGDVRVKLKVGRKIEYFCSACAMETINRDMEKLRELNEELKIETLTSNSKVE